MRKKRFRTALFGYNKREVEAHVLTMEMEMQKRSNVEDRLETLAKENVNLAVELKIARSGFVDAAELMQAANDKVRDLEGELKQSQERMSELSLKLEEALAAQPQDPATVELMELLNRQIEALGGESLSILRKVLGDADLLRRAAEGEPVQGGEEMGFRFPEGFSRELETQVDSARSLMHKIYLLRQQESE
ncbi:MAG: hypothetical protein DBY42_06530 [Bacillota bacterium]|nr:MAG: hypothetical protein DBY42_06530 [Bacillota bacterium]